MAFFKKKVYRSKYLSPLSYLMIYQKEKCKFDLKYPLLMAGVFAVINHILPIKISFLSDGGFVSIVNNLLQISVGFFIAALAAIATASLSGLDEEMVGDAPPYFWGPFKESHRGKKITRRLFLTYLFGYLAFMSIVIYGIGALGNIGYQNLKELCSGYCFAVVSWILHFGYAFLVFQLFSITILGMFFLIDNNIHRKDN